MPEPERNVTAFEDLNLLGKAVFLGGTSVRLLANLIDNTLEKVVDLVVEVEQVLLESGDPNIEDAKILEEYDERNQDTEV